ncbi:MAG: Abi family protein [Oscillospiraceae bacterium]|nr:Abi family protein [Oscillospiraceae bacterium]
MAEDKRWLSFQEQVDRLVQRGCIVDDVDFCIEVLKRMNYYRLTAYFLPFKEKENDRYKVGTRFETVYQIYEFDKRVRAILLSALEDIEIFFRTQIAHYHAQKYGGLGYLDAMTFGHYHKHDGFIEKLNAEIQRNKTLPFVAHHIEKYNKRLPLWVAVELFSFGTVSLFYSDLHRRDQRELAKIMYPDTPYNYEVLRSWLRCCTELRNACAHYGRLYYQIFPTIPKTPKGQHFTLGRRLFDMVYVVRSLYMDDEGWGNGILPQITALIERYQPHINLFHIGFPPNWEEKLKK